MSIWTDYIEAMAAKIMVPKSENSTVIPQNTAITKLIFSIFFITSVFLQLYPHQQHISITYEIVRHTKIRIH